MIDLIKTTAKQKEAYIVRRHDKRGYGDSYSYYNTEEEARESCTESACSYSMYEGKQTMYYVTGYAYGIKRFTKWCTLTEIRAYHSWGYCKPA